MENGEFYRIGETKPRISKARIVAATNRDLKDEIRAGSFRQDLYHRLSVLTIHVPELKERGHDVMMLVQHFKEMYAAGNPVFEMAEEAVTALQKYSFPGNIRELRNIVIRLTAKYSGKTVSAQSLLDELENDFNTDASEVESEGDFIKNELKDKNFHLDDKLSQWEKKYINHALRKCNGNLSKTARMLGVNRTTLYSRLQRLEIKTNAE
jgi:DNA-binding NtrC family response regulator